MPIALTRLTFLLSFELLHLLKLLFISNVRLLICAKIQFELHVFIPESLYLYHLHPSIL
jgi:hypothetical protein